MIHICPHRNRARRFSRLVAPLIIFALLLSFMTFNASAGEAQTPLIKKGDRITMGRYEQDNNAANDKEPISWLVMEVTENRALLIAENSLDCLPYNSQPGSITWEKCSLRAWLNEDFLNTAFTAEEQKAILQVKIKNDKNPDYGTRGGKDTNDRIFLLSLKEAGQFFENDPACRARNSAAAAAKGAWTDSDGYGDWWLRSPGADSGNASFVYQSGEIGYGSYGNTVDYDKCAVRPAMYVDLSARIF